MSPESIGPGERLRGLLSQQGRAFRRAPGTFASRIWQVRRMCLEGVIAGAYDAS